MIRPATAADAPQICAIYNHYVAHTVVTFEEEPVPVDGMIRRIEDIGARLPWLVWADRADVLGYAYAAAWKTRTAYRHSVESTIYLRPEATGRQIGTALYRALLTELTQAGVHAVIGGIALPNPASTALHERQGFEKIGHFREVGLKFNRWVDVGYWQRLLPGGH